MTFHALPVHPYTGLTALAVLPSGRPVWPVIGAAPDDDGGDGGEDTGDDDTGTDDGDGTSGAGEGDQGGDDAPLGPAGEKALRAEKEKRKAEAVKRRAAEKRAADAEAELAKSRKGAPPADAKDSDGDSGADKPDAEEIRREVRAEMAAEASRERVLDKIEVKAAKDFADPADAAALLLRNHDINDFLDDGKPDVEAIQEALAELLEKKPYLGSAAAQGGKRFKGTGDGGAKPPVPARSRSLGEAVSRAIAPK